MKVIVQGLDGSLTPIDVEDSDTVLRLKFKIRALLGYCPEGQMLRFGGKQLEKWKTLSYYGVRQHSVLDLHILLTKASTGPRHFVNLENKDALQKIQFTSYGGGEVTWSMVSSGLNIEGKCTDTSCGAYGKRVICRRYYGTVDITADRCGCPGCGCAIEAITCGFSDCEWSYKGRKKGSEVNIKSEWHISGDEYERFREAGNMIDWEVLIIEAKISPLPRTQCDICLHDINFGEVVQSLATLACGCQFHSHCLANWKTRETQCPTCRLEIGREDRPRKRDRFLEHFRRKVGGV